MVACIQSSDEFIDESYGTLSWATMAASVVCKAQVNLDPSSALIQRLKDEVSALKSQLTEARSALGHVPAPVSSSRTNAATDRGAAEPPTPPVNEAAVQVKREFVEAVNLMRKIEARNAALLQENQGQRRLVAELTKQITASGNEVNALQSFILEGKSDSGAVPHPLAPEPLSPRQDPIRSADSWTGRPGGGKPLHIRPLQQHGAVRAWEGAVAGSQNHRRSQPRALPTEGAVAGSQNQRRSQPRTLPTPGMSLPGAPGSSSSTTGLLDLGALRSLLQQKKPGVG